MRRIFSTLLLTALIAAPAQSAERYFAIFYGAQDGANRPRHSHTWATFVRADTDESIVNAAGKVVDSFTISWLPVSGDFRLLARPVPGRNFTLQESLAWAARLGVQVTTWGPFELSKQGYDLAVVQKARLDSGAVLYKALDQKFRPGAATNCIHAVTDVVPGPLAHGGQNRGNGGTIIAVQHFRPLLIQPERTYPWVFQALRMPTSPQAVVVAE